MQVMIPTQLTRLVGREQALTDLRALVWRGRMLTLCGPGGAGKTRLAVALAEAVQQDFVEGAWWVDLSATFDPDSVAHVIAGAVAPERAGRLFARSTSRGGSRTRRCWCSTTASSLAYGCAEVVTELLVAAQSLRVIATSREPLGVPGEQVWRVPGLPVGDVAGLRAPIRIEQARRPSSSWSEPGNRQVRFDPDRPGVRDAVARICRWLDGMPAGD